MKKRLSLFVCMFNLVSILNADVRIKAMNSEDSLDLCSNNGSSSEFLRQYDKIKLEDKKNMMKEFKQSENWELKKKIEQNEYDYQTADSIDIFSLDGGKTNYVLKILPLGEKESFDSENLAYKKLKSCSGLAKNFGVFFPVHVGSYKKAEVCYVIYEYAGENKRNSKNLSNEKKIKIWNDIVQKKCRALLFLLSKGIMHCDPNYSNWIIQYENSNSGIVVELIDFGSCIDINNQLVPLCYISPFYGNEPATNRELRYLLNSLSFDLCDLLSIPHDKKDSMSYGIFSKVKNRLDEISTNVLPKLNKSDEKISGVISLNKYRELLSKTLATLTIY